MLMLLEIVFNSFATSSLTSSPIVVSTCSDVILSSGKILQCKRLRGEYLSIAFKYALFVAIVYDFKYEVGALTL